MLRSVGQKRYLRSQPRSVLESREMSGGAGSGERPSVVAVWCSTASLHSLYSSKVLCCRSHFPASSRFSASSLAME
jgi:hypothetical protein